MEDFKPYAQYKLTGIEWIGEIPKHWEVNKLKFLAEVHSSNVDKKSKEEEANILLCNYVDVYKNEFINSQISFMESTAPDSQIEKFQLRQGDVLVTKDSEDPKDIAVPAFVEQDLENTLCGYHLAMIRPKRIDGEFLFRLFESKKFNSHFEKGAKGITRYGLSMRIFNNAHIPIPGVDEQRKIARFLRNKTRQIDTTITKLQRLIELLQEERAALINEAVTKGLRGDAAKAAGVDPDPPMKDSGVEWIGEVPGHWEVKRLKYIADITRGAILRPVNEPSYYDEKGEWRYLNISDATKVEKYLFEGGAGLSELGSKKSARVEPNNLILTASATIGKPFINKIKVCIHDGFIPFKNIKIEIEYLYYFLRNPQLYVALGKSNTQKNIYLDEVKMICITVPSTEEEQLKIVKYIETETARIDEEFTLIQKEITLLQEYRQALISEAVTGKIDVREYPIPEAED